MMKRTHYLIWTGTIASLVAMIVGWSIFSGFIIIPAIVIPLGIIVIYACRKMVSPILDDELEQRIRGDAAMRTLEVLFITGAIIMSILFSFTVSTSLTPKISGQIITNEDNTRSMSITIHYLNTPESYNSTVRSFIIRNMEAMNYQEAESYAKFWQEGLKSYYENGLAARIIGSLLILIPAIYGFFYLFYRRRY